jgi:chemotaxis protein CheY-P-specific phosphatase CheC
MHLDFEKSDQPALKLFSEWANLGLSRAASAVSSFSGELITFSRPAIDLIDVEHLSICFEDSLLEESMCLLQKVKGGIDGYFLFTIPIEALRIITSTVSHRALPNTSFQESELSSSVISELANVFAGQLIAGISRPDLGIIELSTTEQTYDMVGAALDFIACQIGIETDQIAFCNSRLIFQESLCGIDFWIIANPNSPFFVN